MLAAIEREQATDPDQPRSPHPAFLGFRDRSGWTMLWEKLSLAPMAHEQGGVEVGGYPLWACPS